MVADDDATREVMLGADGVVGAAAAGTVIVDASTNSPAMARQVAAAAAARGAHYLDAPVSGSTPQARDRQLVFMVGGDQGAFDAAAPLFAAMGRKAKRMGGSGTGATIKLINNMLSGSMNAALSEAMSVTFARSSAAPVETSPKTRSSAARPPSSTAILFSSSERVIRNRSSVGRWIV